MKIVERASGNPSSNLSKYHRARGAGEHFIRLFEYGHDDGFDQRNFEARITEFEALLKSLVSELELFLPEQAKRYL